MNPNIVISEKMLAAITKIYNEAPMEQRQNMIPPEVAKNDPHLFVTEKLAIILKSITPNRDAYIEKYRDMKDLVIAGHDPFVGDFVKKSGVDYKAWKDALGMIKGRRA